MLKLIALAIAAGTLLVLSMPAGFAQSRPSGIQEARWIWGPPGCVRVWSLRSRQTRYGGAPRCRRMPA